LITEGIVLSFSGDLLVVHIIWMPDKGMPDAGRNALDTKNDWVAFNFRKQINRSLAMLRHYLAYFDERGC